MNIVSTLNRSTGAATPASSLHGKTLNERWEVLELLSEDQNRTGGCFSCQYKVLDQKNGSQAFLKAIDLFKKAQMKGQPLANVLLDKEESIRSFRYESSILDICRGHKMDRVVRAIDTGIYEQSVPEWGFTLEVPFIVFELADGDLRTHPGRQVYNLAWRLKVFHGVAVAMRQLHKVEIAHQDLKPSNVLVFGDDFSKIGDLGRATRRDTPSSYEGQGHMGDLNYIPFELLYGSLNPVPWASRRFGADLFMMGCVLTYLITDSSFLVLTLAKLDKQFWPGSARNFESALPHLQRAVEKVLQEIRLQLPIELANDLVELIYRLCDPDYKTRGWPRRLGADGGWSSNPGHLGQFDLQQIVSRCDALSKRATKLNLSVAPIGDGRSFLEFFHNYK